jgi:DNA polymerase-3 subunit alpha
VKPYVPLDVHSEYSLHDSVIRLPELVETAVAYGLPALGLADDDNFFAAVKFVRLAEARGIKPLLGVDLALAGGADARPEDGTPLPRILLYARDREGYRALCALLTRRYALGPAALGVPDDWLEEIGEGVLAVLGRWSDVGHDLAYAREQDAEARLERWLRRFSDRLYLGVTRLSRALDGVHLQATVDLAARRGLPLVALNEVRFLKPSDYDAHEARVCIQEGRTLDDPQRRRRFVEEQYLRRPQEMAELFHDLPEALENTLELARRLNFAPALGGFHLPSYPLPSDESPETFLRRRAREGLAQRLALAPPGTDPRPYEERLERELGVIAQMAFSSYFLIVADFTSWARTHGVPVGPGRGSGAGSLVAYALGITDLDPLVHDLLFERFLNPERISMPDFDIDFCVEGRDRVIAYVVERYGADKVAQIATFGTMAARAVVRDVTRTLGLPYGLGDRVAKLVPFELDMTLEKALADEPELRRLYEEDEQVRNIVDLGRQLEGLVRSVGRHAGGVVIAPTRLTDFVPLYGVDEEGLVTQFDKDDLEAVGLIKFDFLGLRTLTIIERAFAIINAERRKRGEGPRAASDIPLDDPATYALLNRLETTAVFQLESSGMRDLIRRLGPDRFDDLVALVALFRPGPLQSGMVDEFIERKRGKRSVRYPHPALAPILRSTYGVVVYQEQVMEIARVLAGYSLGQADLLRRAMGKKKPEEMAKERTRFMAGALENHVPRAVAEEIFDVMEKFAGYGFNKSHSVAYALLAYQTAWLKAHHPAAYMAAVLTCEMGHTEKLPPLLADVRSQRLPIRPPDVTRSDYGFAVEEGALRYGLGAIKGLGRSAVEALLAQRDERPFASFEDFVRRCLGRINRRTLEILIKAGACDAFGTNRAELLAWLDVLAQGETSRNVEGQGDLFASAGAPALVPRPVGVRPWMARERLEREKEALGLYLSGHPLDEVRDELGALGARRVASVPEGRPGDQMPFVIGGLIERVRRRQGRVFLEVDEGESVIDVLVQDRAEIDPPGEPPLGAVVLLEGWLQYSTFFNGWRFRAARIRSLDAVRAAAARRLVLPWRASGTAEDRGRFESLRTALEEAPRGRTAVSLDYRGPRARGLIDLPEERFAVSATPDLVRALQELCGEEPLRFEYDPSAKNGPLANGATHTGGAGGDGGSATMHEPLSPGRS